MANVDQTKYVPLTAREILVGGQVQAVGFRPFVYRFASRHGLHGWVRNEKGLVRIMAEGNTAALVDFLEELIAVAPPLARPVIISANDIPPKNFQEFCIAASEAGMSPHVHVPPDYFACDDCLREMHDPKDRRYRYPFINCTQCGPRYTLIQGLPYDRSNTTMASFELCPSCWAEYNDPGNRRFHAEPMACPECGPQIEFVRELIEDLFARHLSEGLLDTSADAVAVNIPGGEIMITTGGFTVQPLEFPGGNIGSLAVHGTVNDLAVAGADPLYLTVNAIIEEGFEIALLDRLVASMAHAAKAGWWPSLLRNRQKRPASAGKGSIMARMPPWWVKSGRGSPW